MKKIRLIKLIINKLDLFKDNRMITYSTFIFMIIFFVIGILFKNIDNDKFQIIIEYSFYILLSSMSVESASSLLNNLKKNN